MTGKTRDYLSDLANQKGVRFPEKEGFPQNWASRRIDELEAMPDAKFAELTEEQASEVKNGIKAIQKGILEWTFMK